jgi:hypothetical protein
MNSSFLSNLRSGIGAKTARMYRCFDALRARHRGGEAGAPTVGYLDDVAIEDGGWTSRVNTNRWRLDWAPPEAGCFDFTLQLQ